MRELNGSFEGAEVSRRSFLQASIAATAALGLVGCSPSGVAQDQAEDGEESRGDENPGEWITTACWGNCGGNCANRALVKDGVIVRQKTDDTVEDTWEKPQQRGCVRGRSTRRLVYAADRLKYPMKRKHWSPDDPQGELRGKDEWERITWDEAFDYISGQVGKILEEVGPSGIYCAGSVGYGAGTTWKVIQAATGTMPTTAWDTGSAGSYNTNMPAYGMPEFDMAPYMLSVVSCNGRFDMLNADTIVLHGCNPVWASAGNRMLHFLEPMRRGVEFLYVGPSYNVTASVLNAKWIRVLPGTDVPLLLGVAHVMLSEDDPENDPLIDWDFLQKYTVGFTMDTLPDYASPKECFMDYVLGKYDGVPKTPEWASEICGTPVEDIQYYARHLTKQKKVMLLHSYAPARCMGAEDFPQLFLTVGCMGGHLGKSGHATGAIFHQYAGDGGPKITGLNYNSAGYGSAGDYFNGEILNVTELYDAIIDGKYHYVGNPTPNNDWRQPEERPIDIRMIWSEGKIGLQTVVGIKKGIEAYRKVDFVLAQNFVFNTDARYADIVLPVTMFWERWQTKFSGPKQSFFIPRKVIEPLYDTRTDEQIGREILNRMGFDGGATFREAPEELAWLSTLMLAQTTLPDGTTKPLVSVDQEALDRFGVPGEPVEGVISFDEAMETGIYHADVSDENYRFIAYESFINDPDNNPLPSQSGKFEICCQWKADYLNEMPFNKDQSFKPYPSYTSKGYAWEATYSDWDNKVKGEYPYVAYNPHYLRRSHTEFDNVGQLREAYANPVFVSAQDAAERGVEDGDTVLVSSEFGKVIRHATVLETVMPGSVGLPHGAWVELDEETGICHAGADNFICGPITSACAVSGYNSYPVVFEKYVEEELLPDCAWPVRTFDLD